MAHFRGVVEGARSNVSRLGHKNTGITAHADGWNLGGTVHCWYDEETDQDYISIRITGGSNSSSRVFELTLSQEQKDQINEECMVHKVFFVPSQNKEVADA